MTEIKFTINKLFANLEIINYETLYQYFKENHNKKLYVKKIDDNLVLVHNNYDNMNTNELYQECRSIIIDTSNETKPNIISYTHDNVLYTTFDNYKFIDNDIIEESYEGTMINVYNNNNKWYYSSSRCPSIDDSFYFNKTKSHGEMFNEALGISRESFEELLDINKCYYFVLVHFENKYIIDYTPKFGDNYKKLILVISRSKETQIETNEKILNIDSANKFNSYEEAVIWFKNLEIKEGIIIKRKNNETNKNILIKIPSSYYSTMRHEKPNNINIWINCIEIFQRNDKTYSPNTYLNKYYPTCKLPISVISILDFIIKQLSDELLSIYNYFTAYDVLNNKFIKKNEENYKNIVVKKYKKLVFQINRLQGLQLIIKKKLEVKDILRHLKQYTSPSDIYNLMKIHKQIELDKNEIYDEIKNNIDLTKMNTYVNLYLEAKS